MPRSKKKITYHGRSGHPVVHLAKTGAEYIMVRAVGGGVKRLYQGSKYNTGRKSRGQTKRLKL